MFIGGKPPITTDLLDTRKFRRLEIAEETDLRHHASVEASARGNPRLFVVGLAIEHREKPRR
ncbi:MAG: hypothetical protein U1E42_01300 [Rhodospirillales bacterium]